MPEQLYEAILFLYLTQQKLFISMLPIWKKSVAQVVYIHMVQTQGGNGGAKIDSVWTDAILEYWQS